MLHREVGRLTGEIDRLHQDLLSEADARAAQQSKARQRCQELEQRNADLQFRTQQALEQAAAVERERDGLRIKVRDLLSFSQQHAGGGLPGCLGDMLPAGLRRCCRSLGPNAPHLHL